MPKGQVRRDAAASPSREDAGSVSLTGAGSAAPRKGQASATSSASQLSLVTAVSDIIDVLLVELLEAAAVICSQAVSVLGRGDVQASQQADLAAEYPAGPTAATQEHGGQEEGATVAVESEESVLEEEEAGAGQDAAAGGTSGEAEGAGEQEDEADEEEDIAWDISDATSPPLIG